ncbi:hypothetical protein BDV06DRAFT_75161 [Aspergillus oleicola]
MCAQCSLGGGLLWVLRCRIARLILSRVHFGIYPEAEVTLCPRRICTILKKEAITSLRERACLSSAFKAIHTCHSPQRQMNTTIYHASKGKRRQSSPNISIPSRNISHKQPHIMNPQPALHILLTPNIVGAKTKCAHVPINPVENSPLLPLSPTIPLALGMVRIALALDIVTMFSPTRR